MIKSLTSLRFIFILMIFFHHAGKYAGGGSLAVTFFFVLGGFCMTLGYKDRLLAESFCYKNYFLRRCIKFYPLHWICLLVSLLSITAFDYSRVPIFVVNAALLHSWIPIKDVYFSYNSLSWYLADTMFFAAVFPLLLKWIVSFQNRSKEVIFILISLCYVAIASVIPLDWYHPVLYISPYMRIFDFIFGIFLSLFYLEVKNKLINKSFFRNSLFCLFLIITLIVLLIIESIVLKPTIRIKAPVYWPLIACLILIATLTEGARGALKVLDNKFMLSLGGCSFTFYMIHTLVLKYSLDFFDYLNKMINVRGELYLSLLITIVLSLGIDKYILNPLTKWLTKKIQPSMTAQS